MVDFTDSFSAPPSKRRRIFLQSHAPPLIPGLPDHIAQLCLSLIHPSVLFSVCHSWRRLIYSPSFPPFLSLYAVLTCKAYSDSIHFYSFDPISSHWRTLPPPSPDPPLRILLRHPSFLSRNLPIQSIAVSGNLVLLAATAHNLYPALTRPLIFNPLRRDWDVGPSLPTPRRWCALGASRGSIYVASGIGSQFSIDVARSLEKWDLNGKSGDIWEKKTGLKDGRFSRDAIDAVGWRGKICMVNVKGNAAKEGIIYDVENNEWNNMPDGMLSGWRGPVAAMDEEVMYSVDEAKSALSKYNAKNDVWEELIQSERLKGAEQLAAHGGRICVVSAGGAGISVVDVVSSPARIWAVDLPAGFEAVAVHILPRMPTPEPPESSDQD
ncbi:hypothetical protein K1719_034202 [Acacia pycnantha]|nr:hypothetical protein K1719_034202 [Acacia pycnantha]